MVANPISCKLRFSISGQWKQTLFPIPCVFWVLFPLILLYGRFPGLWYLPHISVLISTWLNTQGGPSEDLQSPLFKQHSPFWHSAQQILASPDFQLCYLNSGRLSGSAWILSPSTAAWKLCPGSKLVIGAHLICLMFLRDHCPLLPHVLCLERCCFTYLV